MKLIIDIPNYKLKEVQNGSIASKVLLEAVKNGKPYEERQQGEWLVSQTMDCHSDIIDIYTCPFCGKREFSAYPYCHCGANLGKGVKKNE